MVDVVEHVREAVGGAAKAEASAGGADGTRKGIYEDNDDGNKWNRTGGENVIGMDVGEASSSDGDDETWLVATPNSLLGSPADAGVQSKSRRRDDHSADIMSLTKMRALLEQATRTKKDSGHLQQVLGDWEAHVLAVHEELLEVTMKLHRERRRYSLKMIEKECHSNRLAVETESLRGVAEAKTASLEALQVLHAREEKRLGTLLSEQQSELIEGKKRIRNLEDTIAKVEAEYAQAKREWEANQVKKSAFESQCEAVGIDIEKAPEQLAEAWAENDRLIERIEDLEVDLEKARRDLEAQEEYYQAQIKEVEMAAEAWKAKKDEAPLLPQHSAIERLIGEEPLMVEFSPRRPAGRLSGAHSHSGSLYSNPFGNGEACGSSVYSENEDILAAEVTNLRLKAKDLESQASVASDNARLADSLEKEASSLRKENQKLRKLVARSMSKESEAREEVSKLTSEANVLHAQLSEVISVLNLGAGQSGDAVSIEKMPSIMSSPGLMDEGMASSQKTSIPADEHKRVIGQKVDGSRQTPDLSAPLADWKGGPDTPQSDTPSPTRVRTITSDTGSDVVALFRTAIDSFDAANEHLEPIDDIFD